MLRLLECIFLLISLFEYYYPIKGDEMFTDVALHEVVHSVNVLGQLLQRRTWQVTEDGKKFYQMQRYAALHY